MEWFLSHTLALVLGFIAGAAVMWKHYRKLKSD